MFLLGWPLLLLWPNLDLKFFYLFRIPDLLNVLLDVLKPPKTEPVKAETVFTLSVLLRVCLLF